MLTRRAEKHAPRLCLGGAIVGFAGQQFVVAPLNLRAATLMELLCAPHVRADVLRGAAPQLSILGTSVPGTPRVVHSRATARKGS